MATGSSRRHALLRGAAVLCLTGVIVGAGYVLVHGWDPLAAAWWQYRVRSADPEAREEALCALGELRDPATLPCLLEALRRDDPDMPGKWRASFAIMRFEGEAIPHLDRALDDPDPGQRRRALLILVALEMNRSQSYLLRAVHDPDPDVRKFALLLALNRGLRWDLRLDLARLAFDDPEPGVRAAALTTVRDRRDVEVIAVLQRAADREDPTTRSVATATLAHLGFKDRIPLVIAWIGNPLPHELHHRSLGRYAADWLVHFVQRIQTPDNQGELALLLERTAQVANGAATPDETIAAGDLWRQWWGRNEARLQWNDRQGWRLAQR